jgi:non-specific serine/threonine protein kinase
MASVVGDRLFFIGGYDETGFNPVVDVWELADGAWVERTSLPEPVGAAAAVTLGETVYVVGGVPGAGLLAYDSVTDTWARLASPLERREHLAAVALGGEVWAIGGRWESTASRTVEIYDPVNDTWHDGPWMNETRSGFGATVIDGGLMVAGGEVFDPVTARDSVEVLAMQVSEDAGWRRSVDLPIGLHGNPLVTLGGRVYLPGGSIEAAAVDNPGQLFHLAP